MPGVRWAFAACAVGSDILVFGGSVGRKGRGAVGFHRGTNHHLCGYRFDTETHEWSNLLIFMPVYAWDASASVLGGLVYIVGAGFGGRDFLRFDPVRGAWRELAGTATDRRGGASFILNGCLYVAGPTSSVERYHVNSDTWTAVACDVGDMPRRQRFFGAVTIPAEEEQDLFDSLIARARARAQTPTSTTPPTE